MDNFNKVFNTFKENSPRGLLSVGENFEERVFSKIKKKKVVRRNIAAAVTGFTLAGFLFLAQAVFFNNKPGEPVYAQQEAGITEEIPVMDDVIFATSDSQATYAIEQVAYYTDDDTI